MKLLLDSTRCQGYGLCQEHAPDQIDIDEWGYASLRTTEVPPGAEDAARAGADSCPNAALRLEK
ncbi:ferredoxin [Streptomyces chryseus]